MSDASPRETMIKTPGLYRRILVEPVTPALGAEISGTDLREPLDPDTVQEIRSALNQWRVVFFRDQLLTSDQLKIFGRRFGALTPAHPVDDGVQGHPEIWERNGTHYRALKIARTVFQPQKPPVDDYNGWHLDTTYVVNPNAYSILQGVEIPKFGGDTLFTNLVLAYRNLSLPIQRLIDGLQAVHTLDGISQRNGTASRPVTGYLSAMHPVVRVHPETGEKALFVNPQLTSHIHGLNAWESRALLDLLIAEMTRVKYVVQFRWTPNTIVMWDNRAVAHAGPINFDDKAGLRIVHRVTVAGETPVGADGFQSMALRGEPLGVFA